MQRESENLQQKNLSFGDQPNFKALVNERKSIQQNYNQNDFGNNQNQYRNTNQPNQIQEQAYDNQQLQGNYNFGALRSTNQSNQVDLKKIQEFMDLNHTGGQKSMGGNGSGSRKSSTSFADEAQKEVQDFNAVKYTNNRNRTGSNQSRNSNSENKKIRQSAGVKTNNMEYQQKDPIGSEVKMAGRRSDDRFSDKLSFFLKNVRDDENSVSSLSKRQKENHQDSFAGGQNVQYYPPFIDDKLSNINDTMMSNAKLGQVGSYNQMPKSNIQVISAIANVFDNIDLFNPNKESVIQQLNDSQINSKFLVADHNDDFENQKSLSPQRESFKVSKQNEKQNQREKQKENGLPMNDETGSFAKDGYGNFGERNSIHDNPQVNDLYNHHNLINAQNIQFQQNECSKPDPYIYDNEFLDYQRQTFNPNDQNLIAQTLELKTEKPKQENKEIEIKRNEGNQVKDREEFKAEVIKQDKQAVSREEREKQIEMMMEQLMASRQNYLQNQQANQQQIQNQSNPNQQKIQKQNITKVIQPQPVQQDPIQLQNLKHDRFQDQFKVWQSQKNQNQSSQQSQNEEGQNRRSSSKVSDQISNQLNQNWDSLASQIQIPATKELKSINPKIQEYQQQIPFEQNKKKEHLNENISQIEIKAIRVEPRANERSTGRQQSFIREDSNTQAQVPTVYVQPSNQVSYITRQQVPTNHSQHIDTQQSFYSQNPNQVQQLFSPLKSVQNQNLNQSEFGATRGTNDQARQQSRSGSRMSQAGRNQRFADGRQSRSGSKSSLANQEDQSYIIQSLSLQNKPHSNSNTLHVQKNANLNQYSNQDSYTLLNNQNQNYHQRPVAGSNRQQMIEINNIQINQNMYQPVSQKPQSNMTSFRSQASDCSLDQTMELKRKQMAEDQAKAMQSQQQLENLGKKRRAEEQSKLLDDLKNSKLFQKPVLETNLRETKASPQRLLKKEPRKISVTKYHDDEFNDIDESTDKEEVSSAIRVSGPQNHRRYEEFQGPLHQRNQQQKFDPTINQDINRNKNSLKVQKMPYNENIRNINQVNMQTQNQSEQSQQPFGTVISSSLQRTNDQYSITLMNNVEPSHQNYSDNKTQAISGYPIHNQQQNSAINYQRNIDATKTKSQYIEKENQVISNYQEFSRVNPQNQKTVDSKIQSSDRGNSASKFFQALSQKRSESRGNGRRNSRSGALQEVINRSNSRGDRFRFFGKKEGEPQTFETENDQQLQNFQPNSFSVPTQKEIQQQSNQQFQNEFQSILQKHLQNIKNRNANIYIAEVLKDLGFIFLLNQISIQDNNRLSIMLEQQRENLNLTQNGLSGQTKYFNENLDNLFKILCCILGLEQENRQSIKLDQSLLDTLLNRIDFEKEDKDVLVLEQLVMIKIMVSRPSFSLNNLQAQQIQQKFYNLAINRNNYIQNQGQFVKQEVQTQRVLSPRIHSGIKQQEQTIKPLHPPISQTNQRPWQGNRPPSRAGSSARQNSNTQIQQSNQIFKPVQTFPETRYQEGSQNYNIQSNSSVTYKQQEYKQLNQALNQRNNQQVQSRSPYRQQNEVNLNFQNQNRQNAHQNLQGNIVKLNQVRPANSIQFCPSEPETIRDSFNPGESDSYIGTRETQRFNEFQKVATPTPLLQNAQPYQFAQSINQARNYPQSKSPLRDNGNKQEKSQQYPQQETEKGNLGNVMIRNQIKNNNQISQQTNSNMCNGQSNINMLNDSFGPIHHTKTESHEQNVQLQKLQNKQKQPICVLKIELDGSHVEEIQVFDGEDPKIVVKRFAQMFNLSDDAVQKLTLQVQQQVQIYNRNKMQKI